MLIHVVAGRIGGVPVIGAATYASKKVAVSCTGHGEMFIKRAAASRVAVMMEMSELTAEQAVKQVLGGMNPGDGGMIAVGQGGDFVLHFTTGGMFRAVLTDTMLKPDAAIW